MSKRGKKTIYGGTVPIMFGDTSCPACRAQYQILARSKGTKNKAVTYYDLSKYPPPKAIMEADGNFSMPTWYIPSGKSGYGTLHTGVKKTGLKSLVTNFSRGSRFGEIAAPEVGGWAKYGKNFPNGKGMEIPNSFTNDITNMWGDDYLVAGTVGREFGPGNTGKIYSNDYVNNIRMAGFPSGDLSTVLFNNRNCNTLQSDNSNMSPGLIYDSKSPQVVGFGRSRRCRFGNPNCGCEKCNCKKNTNFGSYCLYSQMGPAYTKSRIDTSLGGATQIPFIRPDKISDNEIFLGKVPGYNPLNAFGLKPKRKICVKPKRKVCVKPKVSKKIKEGDTIYLKNKKIKVKKV